MDFFWRHPFDNPTEQLGGIFSSSLSSGCGSSHAGSEGEADPSPDLHQPFTGTRPPRQRRYSDSIDEDWKYSKNLLSSLEGNLSGPPANSTDLLDQLGYILKEVGVKKCIHYIMWWQTQLENLDRSPPTVYPLTATTFFPTAPTVGQTLVPISLPSQPLPFSSHAPSSSSQPLPFSSHAPSSSSQPLPFSSHAPSSSSSQPLPFSTHAPSCTQPRPTSPLNSASPLVTLPTMVTTLPIAATPMCSSSPPATSLTGRAVCVTPGSGLVTTSADAAATSRPSRWVAAGLPDMEGTDVGDSTDDGTSRKSRGPDYVCVFCRNNGESHKVYKSHRLKDVNGCIKCPVLRAYTCPTCGATGDDAHTLKYCPRAKESSRVPFTVFSHNMLGGRAELDHLQ